MPSRFGMAFPINGFRGLAVYANPSHGCSPISPPPNLNITKPKWVVVIARYVLLILSVLEKKDEKNLII